MSQTFFHAAVGPRLTTMVPHLADGRLERRTTVTLPANVQYAWPHPTLAVLYVVASDGGPGVTGANHFAQALTCGDDGTLIPRGQPQRLAARPIHCCVDESGSYLAIAYNRPSNATIHTLETDGAIGWPVPQTRLDFGSYAHQVRFTPDNSALIVVTRGNDATASTAEDPGALKVFRFAAGKLTPITSVAPGDGSGYGFGPRHLDFHPGGRWALVSVERQDQLQIYQVGAGEATLASSPTHTLDSLADPIAGATQLAGTVRCHPSGDFVYQANRSDGREVSDGWSVAQRGENSVVVYRLDAASGALEIIQRVMVPAIHVRTFSIHPSGQLLVAATIEPIAVETEPGVELIPAALLVYRIEADGRLRLLRRYEVNTRADRMFWTGMTTYGT